MPSLTSGTAILFTEFTAGGATAHSHRSVVPINPLDRNQDVKPLAAIESGEKEPFPPNRTPIANEKVQSAEGWVALCAQAAVEKDPKKLLELVSEINRLLDARRKRLSSSDNGIAKSPK
jgi:hypothetical protein